MTMTSTEELSNDVYTRRLIVELPDVSGEEADITASWIERAARRDVPGITAEHALGESLPEHVRTWLDGDVVIVNFDAAANTIPRHFTAHEARQLAGALLTAAHDLDQQEAGR